MAIIITGTPGTGKSTLARQLAEQEDRPLVGITELMRERGMDSEWDEERNCFLVDVAELTILLEELVAKDARVVVDGHLSHYLSPAHVTRAIVTKCALPELKERLEARGYDEQKVRENLDCEIFDVCHTEAIEHGHDPEVVWTSEDQPDEA